MEVRRKSDRVMAIVLTLGREVMRIMCVHGPKSRRPEAEKVFFWQWLFRRRQQFALGIYFAVIIHVCLYSQICYYRTSDSVV